MEAFFQIAFSFPTIVYTVLLAVSVLYWLMMLAGLVDLEAFDLDFDGDFDADFDADVDADMDVDAGVDAGMDAGPDADIDGDFDADVDMDADAGEVGSMNALLSFLGLGTVPLMIVVSVFSLIAWVGTFLATSFLFGVDRAAFLLEAAVLAGATIATVPVTGTVMMPFKAVFSQISESTSKRGGHGMVGNLVEITSAEVSERYGRANYDDGGAGVILSIRAEEPNNLSEGDEALVIDYDEKEHIYHVQGYDTVLGDASQAGEADNVVLEREEQEVEREEEVTETAG